MIWRLNALKDAQNSNCLISPTFLQTFKKYIWSDR